MSIYNGSLTSEHFLFHETRIVASLWQSGFNEQVILDQVYTDNLFQYPTEKEIRKKCHASLRRIKCIEHIPFLLNTLADGGYLEARQAALIALMLQNRLVADFMLEVIGAKYRSMDMTLTVKDINLFFDHLREKDETVSGWSDSTVSRIKSVLRNILRETGYLEAIGSEALCPVFLSDDFIQALIDSDLKHLLPAFNVLN